MTAGFQEVQWKAEQIYCNPEEGPALSASTD